MCLMRFMDRGCEIHPGFKHGEIVFVRGRVDGATVENGQMTLVVALCDADGVGEGHDLYIPTDKAIKKSDLISSVKKAMRAGVSG